MKRSISITSAADLLDTSKDTIRDMMDKGQLSGHYLRRERRVYLESISEYQQAHEISIKIDAVPQDKPRRVNRSKTDAARTLEAFGI